MPQTHFYARSAEDSPSADQFAKAEQYHREQLEPAGFTLGNRFEDARQRMNDPLCNRPAGTKLDRALAGGDCVILADPAAAFRDLKEIYATCSAWVQRGIRVVLFLEGTVVDTGALGRFALGFLETILRHRGRRNGERTATVLKERRIRGKATNKPPYGFRIVGPHGKRRLTPCRHTRECGQLFVQWKADGWSIRQIVIHAWKQGLRTRDNREWSEGSVKRSIAGELALQEAEQRQREEATASNRK